MLKLARCFCCYTGCLTVILASSASAKQPVFSIGAVAVNSTAVPGGFDRYVKVLPGDTLTLEIFLRNWSPAGERMNAYQMQLEPLDFTSGSAGAVAPANYKEAREANEMNLENCSVDQFNPEWVFTGGQTITLVDTRSSGYRWMSVLVDTAQAVLCDQDDTMYYTGTLIMQVSDDARGTFTIGFMEDPAASLLLDTNGVMITPLEFEALSIAVQPDVLCVIDRLNGDDEVTLKRADQDGDGKVATGDVRRAVNLLNGG
jgi:hypothetical protein